MGKVRDSRCTGVARLRLDNNPNARQQMVTSKIRNYVAQIQTHNLDMIGQALYFSRLSIAVAGKATNNSRRLETQWEEVAVQAICPPPSGGFHLFDGEREPVIASDSSVTESAAVSEGIIILLLLEAISPEANIYVLDFGRNRGFTRLSSGNIQTTQERVIKILACKRLKCKQPPPR